MIRVYDGIEWEVRWPEDGWSGGVKGGALGFDPQVDYRLMQTDYSRQMPFVTGASEETRRRERNRGRVRLYRAWLAGDRE